MAGWIAKSLGTLNEKCTAKGYLFSGTLIFDRTVQIHPGGRRVAGRPELSTARWHHGHRSEARRRSRVSHFQAPNSAIKIPTREGAYPELARMVFSSWEGTERSRSGASRQRFALNTARSKRAQIKVSRARFGSRKAKGRPRGWPRGFIGLQTASKGKDPEEAGIPFGVSIGYGSVSRWRKKEGERWLVGPDRQWERESAGRAVGPRKNGPGRGGKASGLRGLTGLRKGVGRAWGEGGSAGVFCFFIFFYVFFSKINLFQIKFWMQINSSQRQTIQNKIFFGMNA